MANKTDATEPTVIIPPKVTSEPAPASTGDESHGKRHRAPNGTRPNVHLTVFDVDVLRALRDCKAGSVAVHPKRIERLFAKLDDLYPPVDLSADPDE